MIRRMMIWIVIFGTSHLYAHALSAAPGELQEMKMNLIDNGDFRRGMDFVPKSWIWFDKGQYFENLDTITYEENGCTFHPKKDKAFQISQWHIGDLNPNYRISFRMKQEGGKNNSSLLFELFERANGYHAETRKGSSYFCKKRGEWEDVTLNVEAGDHYGFKLSINVASDAQSLSIEALRVEPVFNADPAARITLPGEIGLRGIFVPAAAARYELLAAGQLQTDFYLLSGAVIPIYQLPEMANKPEAGYIYLGKAALQVAAVTQADLKSSHRYAYCIKSDKGCLGIAGNSEGGVICGAIAFLRQMGATRYAPGVYAFKKSKELAIPKINTFKAPEFSLTRPTLGASLASPPEWLYGYLPVDTYVGESWGYSANCAFYDHPTPFLVPYRIYGEKHPEYYAMLKDGRRMTPKDVPDIMYMHLCLSNPEVHRIIAERIAALIEQQPECQMLNIAQGDGHSWCQCENCKKWDVDSGNMQDRLLTYANHVGRLVAKKHPDKKLMILAYGSTEEPPLKARPDGNIIYLYAFWPSSWPVWANADAPKNKHGKELVERWAKFTSGNTLACTYLVNVHEMASKLRLLKKNGYQGFDFNNAWNWSAFPEELIYIAGQMVWDLNLDLDNAIDQALTDIYGKDAAEPLKQYFKLYHDYVYKATYNMDDPKYKGMFEVTTSRLVKIEPQVAKAGLRLLNLALEKTTDRSRRLNIERAKILLLMADLNTTNPINAKMADVELKEFANKLVEFTQLARKAKIGPLTNYQQTFGNWVWQVAGLDFDRSMGGYLKDPKVDEFLKNPCVFLNGNVGIQDKTKNGWRIPAKGFFGGESQTSPIPIVTVKRPGSTSSKTIAYLYLDKSPAGLATLSVTACDDEPEKPHVSIKINDKEILRGPSPLKKGKRHDTQTLWIPAECFKAGKNIVEVENITPAKRGNVKSEAGSMGDAVGVDFDSGWFSLAEVEITFQDNPASPKATKK